MILITGGTGYIGSHTCVALVKTGRKVILADNLSNSRISVVDRLQDICGVRPHFVQCDIRNKDALDQIFDSHPITSVMHFAGLKAVGESVQKPLEYFDNNVNGTLSLLAAMQRANVRSLVFSSSATVYGDPAELPIREDFPRSATNPYGRSKLIVEDILHDFHNAHPDWRIANLRYFNPVGAHESGRIGEDPEGIPNNLVPYIGQVAIGRLDKLNVFGGDYPTPDGTGVRDYIHVMDLAEGHVAALDYLQRNGGFASFNLGTGKGASVLEMIRAFESASGRRVQYRIVDRRPGDVARCFADPGRANRLLGWQAKRGIDEMCHDAWRWQQNSLEVAE